MINKKFKNNTGTTVRVEYVSGDIVHFKATEVVLGEQLTQRFCAKLSDFKRRFPIEVK